MAVDSIWPETQSTVNTCSSSVWCYICIYTIMASTNLFQLFGDKGGVFPKLGSEALCQDQSVEQSGKASRGRETEELDQAWLGSTHNQRLKQHINIVREHVGCVYNNLFSRQTFADAHSIPEDPCHFLGQPKLLDEDGTQLSLNQAKTQNKHIVLLHVNSTDCVIFNPTRQSSTNWLRRPTSSLSSHWFWFFLQWEI